MVNRVSRRSGLGSVASVTLRPPGSSRTPNPTPHRLAPCGGDAQPPESVLGKKPLDCPDFRRKMGLIKRVTREFSHNLWVMLSPGVGAGGGGGYTPK